MPVTVGPVVTEWQARNLDRVLRDARALLQVIQQLQNQTVNLNTNLNLNQTNQGMNTLAQRTRAAGLDAQAAQRTFKGLYDTLSVMGRAVDTVGSGMVHMGQVLATVAYRMQLLAVPAQLVIGLSAKQALELDKSLRLVATQINVTADSVAVWEQKHINAINKIAVETGQKGNQIADSMYFIVSSMDATEQQASAMLEPIAKFATLGNAVIEDVTQAATTGFQVFGNELARYGETQEQVNQLLGKFFFAVQHGKGEVQNLVSGFGRFATAGADAGASLDEVLLIWTALSRVFTPDQATTSAENFFRAITNPSKEATEALAALDVSLYETVNATGEVRRRSILDVFDDILSATSKMQREVADDFMQRIFGNVRSNRAAIALSSVTGELREWERIMTQTDLTAETERAFQIMQDAPVNQMERFGRALEALGGDILRSGQGVISSALEFLIGFIEDIRAQGPEAIDTLSKFILTFAALPPIFLALSTAIIVVGAALQSASLLLSPVGILAAAGAWLTFGDTIKGVVPAISQAFSEDGLGGVVRLLVKAGEELGLIKRDFGDGLLKSLGLSTEDINTEEFDNFVTSLRELGDVANSIKEGLTSVFNEFTDFLDKLERRAGITGTIVGFIEKIIGLFNSMAGMGGVKVDPNWFDLLATLSAVALVAPALISLFGTISAVFGAGGTLGAVGALFTNPAFLAAIALLAGGNIALGAVRSVTEPYEQGQRSAFETQMIEAFTEGWRAVRDESTGLMTLEQRGRGIMSAEDITNANAFFAQEGISQAIANAIFAGVAMAVGVPGGPLVGTAGAPKWGLPAARFGVTRGALEGPMTAAEAAAMGWAIPGLTPGRAKESTTLRPPYVPADDGEKAANKIKSAIESVLKPTSTGAPDPTAFLDAMGLHIDTADEDARRLASVMVEGFGSEWAQYFQDKGFFSPEDLVDDQSLRAASARILRDFQDGLRPDLYNIDEAVARTKRFLLGQENTQALVDRILAEVQGSIEAAPQPVAKVKVDYSDDTPPGLRRLIEGTATVDDVLESQGIPAMGEGIPFVGGMQHGGYAGRGLYAMGEKGREFVLNNTMTRAVERAIGGPISNAGLARALHSGTPAGSNQSISIGTVNLPSVTNANEFVQELSQLAENYGGGTQGLINATLDALENVIGP